MKDSNKVEKSKISIVPLTERWFTEAKVSAKDKEHLLKSLHNLQLGRDPSHTFKLYGKEDVSVITNFLNSVNWSDVRVPKGWKEYEFSRLEKFGPQGGYRPWEEISELFHMYQNRLSPCTVRNWVMNELYKSYESIFCHMLSVDTTLAKLIASSKIQDRAAGCRQFSKKKTDKEAQRVAIKDFKSGLSEHFFMYTFSRYYKNKIRLFMPGPFSSMLDQARFIQPFLTAIQNDIRLKGWKSKLVQHADKLGFDDCFRIMSDEIKHRINPSFDSEWTIVYVQGDFEKMDTTTGSSQYENIFIPCIAKSFRFGDKSNNYELLRKSMIKTTTMPIASPEGVMIGEHGTGSGMENTNIGEGICNDYYQLAVIDELTRLCRKENIEFRLLSRRVNGDDSCFVFALKSKLPKILARFKELIQEAAMTIAAECGFVINEKWRIDTEFGLYCQNGFSVNAKTLDVSYYYPSALIFNSIINPEHEYIPSTWDKDYRDIDVVGKLDNGKGLPYFKELVKYVANGTKYPLCGTTERETQRIISKYERYKSLQPLSERFNRIDYDIKVSPTIGIIRDMRRSRH